MSNEKNEAKSQSVKPTIEPAIGGDGAQMHVTIGGISVPVVIERTPEHQRKHQGAMKTIAAKSRFLLAFSAVSVTTGLEFIQSAVLAAGDENVQKQLIERITDNWVGAASERSYTVVNGTSVWDEALCAKELSSPAPTRKSGPTIADLREQLSETNEAMVSAMELISQFMANGNEWTQQLAAEAREKLGREFNDPEALIEFRLQLKSTAGTLKAQIGEKERKAAEAQSTREKNKKNKKAATETTVSVEPVTN